MNKIDENVIKKIYLNILKAILIISYFFVFNISYENISAELFLRGTQIFTMIFLFISIYIFEKAYKKDDGNLAIQGIEVLVLSIFVLTIKYITNRFEFKFKAYTLTGAYIFSIYFVLKSIIIYTNWRKELISSYSDIREIVKKEEPIKKEATKKKKVTEEVKNENKEKLKKANNSKIKKNTKSKKKKEEVK